MTPGDLSVPDSTLLDPTAPDPAAALTVPAAFAARVAEREGPAGRRWLAALPGIAARCLRRWDLTPDGAVRNGFCAVVLPVRRADGTPAALKLGWPHPEGEHEALALSTWDGDGAVRLLGHAPADWAVLLERLDPDTSLADVPLPEALATAACLIHRLDRPAPAVVGTVRELAARWAEELPTRGGVPAELLAQATAYCRELGPRAGGRLVNQDLHYANVLRGEREPWLVIDPKPVAGDAEFGLIPLLWNRVAESDPATRLGQLADAAGLDPGLARRWTFVRAVVEWADAARNGGGAEGTGDGDTSDGGMSDPAHEVSPLIARTLA